MASLVRGLPRAAVRLGHTVKGASPSLLHTGPAVWAKVQKPAPSFQGKAVVNHDFRDIALHDYRVKYLVLFFYPLDFTFVCPTEIVAFSDRIEEFRALNTELVGVSVDSHYTHFAWINTPRTAGGLGPLNYPLLADLTKKISSDYGVLLEDGISLRASFIIDSGGMVRQITINDLPVGRSVDETLRLVKAFQFVERHGEVCPANWDPDRNATTIKADPVGAREYFAKQTE
ncbi:peroxiredoxin-2-like [Anopheles cruzii]|uniref:peroxiredoxin-2-like n=1 Tax=Anopheles cruzii TaxID=68878 RepID=UPI0022EC1F87|nr:peroxiredoxin-2-like [Anopheles cruzii]